MASQIVQHLVKHVGHAAEQAGNVAGQLSTPLGNATQQAGEAAPAPDFMHQLTTLGVQHYLIAAALLFCIGLYGVTTSRNLIKVLMSIELLLNAVNLNFVAFSKYVTPDTLHGQIVAIFILTIAAAEAGVGLAIALAIYKHFKTVDVDKIHLMKW